MLKTITKMRNYNFMTKRKLSDEQISKLISEYNKSLSIKVAAAECNVHQNTASKYLQTVRKRLPARKIIVEKYNELKNIMDTARWFNTSRSNIVYAIKTYKPD